MIRSSKLATAALTFVVAAFVLSWVLLSTPLRGLLATLILGIVFHTLARATMVVTYEEE